MQRHLIGESQAAAACWKGARMKQPVQAACLRNTLHQGIRHCCSNPVCERHTQPAPEQPVCNPCTLQHPMDEAVAATVHAVPSPPLSSWTGPFHAHGQ